MSLVGKSKARAITTGSCWVRMKEMSLVFWGVLQDDQVMKRGTGHKVKPVVRTSWLAEQP